MGHVDELVMPSGMHQKRHRRLVTMLKHGASAALLMNVVMLVLMLASPSKMSSQLQSDSHMNSPPECAKPKRSYKRHESFLPISGVFDLYDELDLATTTGSVNVVIRHRAGCGPSILKVHSAVGSVDISFAEYSDSTRFFLHKAIELGFMASSRLSLDSATSWTRPIISTISTNTGAIRTVMPIGNGSSASLTSSTGTINSRFLVQSAGSNDSVSQISTATTIGNQYITILAPPGCTSKYCDAITGLAAKHSAMGSGNIELSYPPQWQGQLHARTEGTGLVQASGEDLHYSVREDREVQAWRGEHGSSVPTIEAIAKGTGTIVFDADGKSLTSDAETQSLPSAPTVPHQHGPDFAWWYGRLGDRFAAGGLFAMLGLPWIILGSCSILVVLHSALIQRNQIHL